MSLTDVTISKRRLLEDDDGKIIPVVAIADHNGDGDPALNWGYTQFGELVAAERFNVIGLTSVFGVSALRDVTSASGTGASVARSGSVIEVVSGTDAAGVSSLQTAERAPYQPGSLQEGGIGLRVPSTSVPTGSQDIRWGVWDGDDGIFFGYDASGPYVGYEASGSETTIAQTAWNVDKLDGTGPSGLTLDLDDGYVFRLRYAWYGYGSLAWAVVLPDADDYSRPVPIHRVKVDGGLAIDNPNLPIRVQVSNGGTGSNSLTVQVGGRNLSRIGPSEITSRRLTGDRRIALATSTTVLPLVSLRRKSGFVNETSVRLNKAEVLTDADSIWEIYLNPTLTAPSWGTPTNATAGETSLEADVSASALSGGTLIASGLLKGGVANRSDLSAVELPPVDFPGTQHMTLAIRTITSTGSATGLLQAVEGW